MFKQICILLLLAVSCTGIAQTQGELFVGVGSDLTQNSVVNLQLSPTVGYQVSDKIQVGGNVQFESTENTDYDWISVYARYYPGCSLKNGALKPYAQASAGISSSDDLTVIGLRVGVTGFLNDWFYLEPSLGYSFVDNEIATLNRVGVSLSCGIRL